MEQVQFWWLPLVPIGFAAAGLYLLASLDALGRDLEALGKKTYGLQGA